MKTKKSSITCIILMLLCSNYLYTAYTNPWSQLWTGIQSCWLAKTWCALPQKTKYAVGLGLLGTGFGIYTLYKKWPRPTTATSQSEPEQKEDNEDNKSDEDNEDAVIEPILVEPPMQGSSSAASSSAPEPQPHAREEDLLELSDNLNDKTRDDHKKTAAQFLGISIDATAIEAKASFNTLSLIFHPDRYPNKEKGETIFKGLIQARKYFSAHATSSVPYQRSIDHLVSEGFSLAPDTNGIIDLSNRGLDDLNGLENALNRERVLHLRLENNLIPDLTPFIFAVFPNLTTLNLSNNAIRTISPKAFTGISELYELCLANNHVSSISQDIFLTMKALKTLDISRNHLAIITDKTFLPLRLLQSLNLANNELTEINKETFFGLRKLQTLQLQNNRIYHIDPQAFDDLITLQETRLDHNMLSAVSLEILKQLCQKTHRLRFFLSKQQEEKDETELD